MGMDPNPAAARRLDAGLGTVLEVVGHGLIVEADGYGGYFLFGHSQVLDVQQVILGTNAEEPHFRFPGVEKQQ
jgi:hypothetical protein